MKELLIGRKREQEDLLKWIESERSEFIAIYGRRRVGKTFLVKQTVAGRLCFQFSGSHGQTRKEQLLNFGLALRDQFDLPQEPIPDNWIMAFHQLKKAIENCQSDKKIIFLDELPWIDTPKSGFVAALENFWNSWAYWRSDVKLIVCGSATSWIINKIIRARGGLHNRLTHSMLLRPFELSECEEYFREYGFRFSQMQVAECYMIMGGIPYYFSLMDRSESLAQNVDRLFFYQDAPLRNEFNNLYKALFKDYQSYIKVIKALGEKGVGLTRQEILGKTGLDNNGEFSKMLENLELCGFIRSYLPFRNRISRKVAEKSGRNTLYQLIDFYSLFYLKFHEEEQTGNEKFWLAMANSPRLNAWRGISFEMLCLCHVNKIKEALGIADVSTHTYSWRGEADGHNVQIDLLLDRKDDTVNLCEMKFTRDKFVITKEYAEKLERKLYAFMEATGTRKTILLTLITSNGITDNTYSDLVQKQVVLSQLF